MNEYKCPDCKDTGEYIGFLHKEPCLTCNGTPGAGDLLFQAKMVFAHHVTIHSVQPFGATFPRHAINCDGGVYVGSLYFPADCISAEVALSANIALSCGVTQLNYTILKSSPVVMRISKDLVIEECKRLGIKL